VVTIAQSSLYSNVWTTIYNIIKNNVTDPNSRSKLWIFGAFPDRTGTKFPGYPIIVIRNPSSSDRQLSYKGTVRRDTISVFIEVYSDSSINVDVVFDAVRYQLRQNESSLITDGLRNMRIQAVTPTDIVVGDKNIHASIMEVRFDYV